LIQDNRIYWIDEKDLMTLKINENNITRMGTFDKDVYLNCIDWVARNLYFFTYRESDYSYILKFDLAMWENGIIKFDEIVKSENIIFKLDVSPSMGYVYYRSPEKIIFYERFMQICNFSIILRGFIIKIITKKRISYYIIIRISKFYYIPVSVFVKIMFYNE